MYLVDKRILQKITMDQLKQVYHGLTGEALPTKLNKESAKDLIVEKANFLNKKKAL